MTQTAKNYAQALFELHVDAESVKTTEEILKTVPEVGRSLTNPTISFRVKEQIIGRIFPGEMRNFIKVVCRNQKADMLEEIFQAYREIERKQSKTLEATLLYVTAPTKEPAGKDQTVPVSEVSCKGSSAFLNKRRKPDRRIYSPGGRSGV